MLSTLTLDPLRSAHFLVRFVFVSRGSMSVSRQLRTYLSPNPTLTLTYGQLTIAELGEGRAGGGGRCVIAQILTLIRLVVNVPTNNP